MAEDRMLNDEILLGLIKANGGGGGGTNNYEDLNNLPKINSVELKGNKSLSDLGIASAQSVSNITNGESINNFAGVETTLATKQNATDNSLQTTDKTVVGAINEHEGDISSLKSGLTDLTDHVDGDATTYPYADVITVEDAVPANLADCSVKIEPVQDLHGYDKPWVGGAGKNKLPLVLDDLKTANTDGTWSGDTYTLNGVSFTVLKDADGNVTGVKTGNNQTATGGNASFNIVTLSQGVTLDNGQYIGNGCPANGSTSTYYLRFTGGFDASSDIGEGTGVKTVTTSAISVYIRVTEGATVSNLIFAPMIRLATETDATFAPYTNICPISGHTEAVVTREGNDVWSGNDTYTGSSAGYIIPNFTIALPAGTYSFEFDCVNANDGMQFEVFKDSSTQTVNRIYNSGGFIPKAHNVVKFTINEAGTNLRMWSSSTTNVTISNVRLYSTVDTYTLALGDTIYGGTVDFKTGVMTVTHKYVEYGNGNGWERASNDPGAWFYKGDLSAKSSSTDIISDKFKQGAWNVENCIWLAYQQVHVHPDTSIAPSGSTEEGLAEWKTWLSNNHLQVCYPLKTSAQFTVQLTPQQIQLLKGTNTLTASTGDISVTVNGVSGAIGSVQEQVNELEMDLTNFGSYSNTEVAVGTYQGHILYRREFDISALPNSDVGYTPTNLGNVSIVNMYGIATNGTVYIPLPFIAIGSNMTTLSINMYFNENREIVIATGADRSGFSAKVVLYYYYS